MDFILQKISGEDADIRKMEALFEKNPLLSDALSIDLRYYSLMDLTAAKPEELSLPERFAALGSIEFTVQLYRGNSTICIADYWQQHYLPLLDRTTLLNGDYVLITAGTASRLSYDDVKEHFAKCDSMCGFKGMTIDDEKSYLQFINSCLAADSGDQVLLARKKAITHEYRCFCYYHDVFASSLYFEYGEIIEVPIPAKEQQKVHSVAENANSVLHQLKRVPYVIDICRTERGEYKVLEVNCPTCSGLYACPPYSLCKMWKEYISDLERGKRKFGEGKVHQP
jgi:hypothetical protein